MDMRLAQEVALPWKLFNAENSEHIFVFDADDQQVVRFHKCQSDIAAHVIACVNACRGISTEDLLTSNFGEDSVEVGALLGQTMQQRDDLLESLIKVTGVLDLLLMVEGEPEHGSIAWRAREAIANATITHATESEGGHCD